MVAVGPVGGVHRGWCTGTGVVGCVGACYEDAGSWTGSWLGSCCWERSGHGSRSSWGSGVVAVVVVGDVAVVVGCSTGRMGPGWTRLGMSF